MISTENVGEVILGATGGQRDIEDFVKTRLQRRAKRHGHSMEEEVRDILRSAVAADETASGGLGTEISRLFAKIAALMRKTPDAKVITWLDAQSQTQSGPALLPFWKFRFGLQIMATGKKRSLLSQAFEHLLEGIGHRIAAFDDGAAAQAASLMASRERRRRPVELRDTMIAGIVPARHASLATRNVAHFEDLTVPVLNPWTV